MARISFAATLGTDLGEGRFATSAGRSGDAAAAAAAIDTTTVAANVATLVADGATPTQAHVTTLNTNWATLLALVTAAKAAGTADVVISVNTATVTSQNGLKAALRRLLLLAAGDGSLTP